MTDAFAGCHRAGTCLNPADLAVDPEKALTEPSQGHNGIEMVVCLAVRQLQAIDVINDHPDHPPMPSARRRRQANK